jgi:Lipocalin-like domain
VTASSDNSAKILGVWKLVSFEAEIQTTGQKEPVMGQNPTGYVIFTPEGRAFFMLTGEGRKPARTVQERACWRRWLRTEARTA